MSNYIQGPLVVQGIVISIPDAAVTLEAHPWYFNCRNEYSVLILSNSRPVKDKLANGVKVGREVLDLNVTPLLVKFAR